MNKLLIKKLSIGDIPQLNTDNTLFLVDFRATGETLSHEIYDMFKYENLSIWLQSNKKGNSFSVVNSLKLPIQDNRMTLLAPTSIKPSISLVKRIKTVPKNISKIWMAIPHPDADVFAKDKNLEINYTYDNFIKLNNKITQKKYLGDFTPKFKIITNQSDINKAVKDGTGFLKASVGAGGYGVIDLEKDGDKALKKSELILNDKSKWYLEERASGEIMSVQVYRDNNGKTTLFGYTAQYIEGTNYVGAEFLPLESLSESTIEQIDEVCRLLSPLIEEYQGFFGIDFAIDDNKKILVLEINVRMTAATIPMLLANSSGVHEKVEYFEDVAKNQLDPNDIILTKSPDNIHFDILRFKDKQSEKIGDNVFLQLVECKNMPSKMTQETCEKIKETITETVCPVIGVQFRNFWPYGWTVSFILSESHCVLSSWHMQKNILVDIFTCSKIDVKKFSSELEKMFDGRAINIQIDPRRTE